MSRARQAAFHCGQLLGLARRHPNCFIYQPYCTFHAGTILWSIAPFLNGTDIAKTSSKPADDEPILLLDDLPRLNALERRITPAFASEVSQRQRILTDWMQAAKGSERFKIAMEEVPDVSLDDGRAEILNLTARLLDDPEAPPIAQRFKSVIGHLQK